MILMFFMGSWLLLLQDDVVVSHIKVLSDKVEDVSSIEAWKASFIKDGMKDDQKALAVWKTVCKFQHQDAPPHEYLQHEDVVQDPIKIFNVYGYGFCSMASCCVECLSRHVGLESRGRIITSHSVPEVKWDGAWHLLDGSLMTFFPKSDGRIAAVDEIISSIGDWYSKNPDFRGNDDKLRRFMSSGGWKKGPDVLSRCPFYDHNGWLPAATHGWYSTMEEYNGRNNAVYEYGYSQGYRVNVQLRPGLRLVRHWSNQGLHVNMSAGEGGGPGCLTQKVGEDSLRYTPKDGDLSNGRVGNGTLEYRIPPGTSELRMPSSYVYLKGELIFESKTPAKVSISENHGLDWKELGGEKKIDLTPHIYRRYDYRLKSSAPISGGKIVHHIQHSQRALPALGLGKNTITFTTGPNEGTVTIEGSTNASSKGKQLLYTDFHPQINGIGEPNLLVSGAQGEITFPIETPGDLVRIRFGCHYRARDAKDAWDLEVSFDGGKTFKTVDRAAGPTAGHCKYVTASDAPAKTRRALVRYKATNRNTTMIFDFRIDADYAEPRGGFKPVKITYQWEENGQPKENVHVAQSPKETYVIMCAAKPTMKSLILELAE